jgi:hypothetical protein
MATTPPAAMLRDNDSGISYISMACNVVDAMEVDQPVVVQNNEADVESEGATVSLKSNNHTLEGGDTISKPESSKETLVEIDDDDDEDADEETFAVEKVVGHRIGKKQNVRVPIRFTEWFNIW